MQGHIFLDDSQIDEMIVKRGEVIKGGQVSVELYEIAVEVL